MQGVQIPFWAPDPPMVPSYLSPTQPLIQVFKLFLTFSQHFKKLTLTLPLNPDIFTVFIWHHPVSSFMSPWKISKYKYNLVSEPQLLLLLCPQHWHSVDGIILPSCGLWHTFYFLLVFKVCIQPLICLCWIFISIFMNLIHST